MFSTMHSLYIHQFTHGYHPHCNQHLTRVSIWIVGSHTSVRSDIKDAHVVRKKVHGSKISVSYCGWSELALMMSSNLTVKVKLLMLNSLNCASCGLVWSSTCVESAWLWNYTSGVRGVITSYYAVCTLKKVGDPSFIDEDRNARHTLGGWI